MRPNLTPFVDLFSILAIGLLIIMSVTSGTEKPVLENVDYTIVQFYLGRPPDLDAERLGVPMDSLVRVEPYFLVAGREVLRGDLAVRVDVHRQPDSIQVMARGFQDGLAVGFRIAEILDPVVLLRRYDTKILKISGEHDVETQSRTLGAWLDPVACMAGDTC